LSTIVASGLSAQTSLGDLDKTRLEIARIEELVREGAVAKTRLDQAKASLADAEDDRILKRTLFGHLTVNDLTTDQAAGMVAAARRRLERMTPRLEAMRKLADEGVIARTELAPLVEERDLRARTLQLAESRERTLNELAALIRAEELASEKAAEDREALESITPWRVAEKYDGEGLFRLAMLPAIDSAFRGRFERPLPVSALGMTELHRSLGFDHRDRVDVALTPDSVEGIWLRRFLETNRIPYFAFRGFVPGQSTAPHIHIGLPSLRLPRVSSASGGL
jgi:hypothetical protein